MSSLADGVVFAGFPIQVVPGRTQPYAISDKALVGCNDLTPVFGEGYQQLLEVKPFRARR